MGTFLQSPEWEEIQHAMGRTTARIRSVLVIQHDLPFGLRYLYAPRPDVGDAGEFFTAAAAHARTVSAMSLRIESAHEFNIQNSEFSITEVEGVQPRRTALIDLTKTDDELLAAMHPKARYNIRLAERHGVSVRWEEGPEAIATFYRLLQTTSIRDRFRLHPKHYYTALARTRSPSFSNLLAFAYHDGKLAAAAMVNSYRGRATYLHGASAYELRPVMAPRLLHWEIMRAMRVRGCGVYDFWGVDERRWPGVTRFKRGFGGAEISHPPAYDVVFRQIPYGFYRAQRVLRSRKP